MKQNINFILSGLCVLLLLSSCTKRLDLSPVSSITDANFWKTPEQIDAFVTGVHAQFRNNASAFQSLGEMRADVFGTDPGSSSTFTGEATQGVERMWTQNLDLDNSGVSNFGGFYYNITQVNLLINKLSSSNVVTAANRSYYLGIGYGMRAFYYFQLLRSWGNVIIQTEPVSSIDISNLAKAAAPQADVMTLIKADIDSSSNNFGSVYAFKNNKGFWSKSATLMLKAEVYLWTSYRGGGAADATVAKNALTDIQTNVPSLSLLTNFADVFASSNKGNNEMIFAIRYGLNEAVMSWVPGTFEPQTSLIVNFHDSVGARQFNATTDNWGGLLRAPVKISTFRSFNDKDSRKWYTLQPAYNKVSTNYVIAGAFVKKYPGEQNAGSRSYTNDFPIYRYADLLLLMAEAKSILGQDPATEINLVRRRALGTNYVTALAFPNQPIDANVKEALLQERLYEFIFEGKRWYDLRRMGDNFVYGHTSLPATQAYKLFWPVDRNSLTNNRSLEQTTGYSKF